MGMLLLDHQMNNPTLITFCSQAMEHIQRERESPLTDVSIDSDIDYSLVKRKRACARFRWRLVWTLLHNQHLVYSRKIWRNSKGTIPR